MFQNELTKREFKTKQVLNALLNGETLSSVDMLYRFDLYRASSIIHYLRNQKGYNIKTVMVPNSDGIGVHGTYFMPNPSNPKNKQEVPNVPVVNG